MSCKKLVKFVVIKLVRLFRTIKHFTWYISAWANLPTIVYAERFDRPDQLNLMEGTTKINAAPALVPGRSRVLIWFFVKILQLMIWIEQSGYPYQIAVTITKLLSRRSPIRASYLWWNTHVRKATGCYAGHIHWQEGTYIMYVSAKCK